MLTVTLGTQASGSTWLFNVVRSLLEVAGRTVFSSASDEGVDALDRMPLDANDVLLKSHAMDQRLLRIARLAGAKILVSTRDPRDSVVSQRERFGSTVHQALAEISRGFATITSLPADLAVLRFSYEDRFMERPETVKLIADFLDIDVCDEAIAQIFESLLAENVRLRIAAMLDVLPRDATPCHDPVTHWHPSHVGDGRTGKWRERLDVASQDIVAGCLSPMASLQLWHGEPLRWSAQLFVCNAGLADQATVGLRCEGTNDYVAYGPYLHIPCGRWRAIPDIRLESFSDIRLDADVFLPWEDRRLANRTGLVSHDGAPGLSLEFDHHDYFQPVEMRLVNTDGVFGALVFGGWALHWLGPIA